MSTIRREVYLGNHRWEHDPKPDVRPPRRETFWACPECGSRRVHIMSDRTGILCCGFHPFESGPLRSSAAIRVIPPPLVKKPSP